MLIPSIDLQGGRVVQLVQGDKLAIASDDLDGWIAKFSKFPKVQLIDLDAAMSRGNNDALVRQIAARLPCRVGGGVRSVRRAEELIAAGAQAVIAGSGLFRRSPDGDLAQMIDHDFARALADTVGMHRVIAAVDSRAGRVCIHGWKTVLPLTAVQAVQLLEGYCDEFLYTHVDKEGLMQGTDMAAIKAVAKATERKLTAAGGITTREEIDALDALGIDAVVGMAIYTGLARYKPVRRRARAESSAAGTGTALCFRRMPAHAAATPASGTRTTRRAARSIPPRQIARMRPSRGGSSHNPRSMLIAPRLLPLRPAKMPASDSGRIMASRCSDGRNR